MPRHRNDPPEGFYLNTEDFADTARFQPNGRYSDDADWDDVIGQRIVSFDRVDGWPVLTLENGQRVRFSGGEDVDAVVLTPADWAKWFA